MTSLSTASAGIKPVTSILDSAQCYSTQWSFLESYCGGTTVPYLSAGGLQTLLNVTGSGYVTFLVFGGGPVSTTSTMTVSIDGVEVFNPGDRGNITNSGFCPIGGLYQSAVSLSYVPYSTSFAVTVNCNVDAYLTYNYYET